MTDDTPARTLAALAAQNNLQLAPTEFAEDELHAMARDRENLTVLAVVAEDVEGFGTKYSFTAQRPDGSLGFVSLWANLQRDATAVALMQLCLDGPVSGCRISNRGTDKKPFWVIVPV